MLDIPRRMKGDGEMIAKHQGMEKPDGRPPVRHLGFFHLKPNGKDGFLIFIYLLLAVLGLHCCAWAFSSFGEQGRLSSCSVQASRCSGFSCCEALALGLVGFSSCRAWAQ